MFTIQTKINKHIHTHVHIIDNIYIEKKYNFPNVGVSVASVMSTVVNESVDGVSERKGTTKGDHGLCETNDTCSRCGLTILHYSF